MDEHRDLYEGEKPVPLNQTSDIPIITENHYAGFGIRLVAYLIDGFILSVAFSILSLFIHNTPSKGFTEVIYNPGNFLDFILVLIYFVYFESGPKQATPGKMVLNLKVVKQDGSPMTKKDAVIRYVGKIFSAIIFLIGYIMVIFDDKKRALHDRLANTYVIKI